jgi:hypothetical protein
MTWKDAATINKNIDDFTRSSDEEQRTSRHGGRVDYLLKMLIDWEAKD